MEENREETTEKKESQLENKEVKEVRKLQFHWYFLGFFIIYMGSFLPSGLMIFFYMSMIFVPFFMNISNLIILFTDIRPILIVITLPLFLIACYVLHLLLIGVFTRFLWQLTEKISPSEEGIIPRSIPSKKLNFYHIRSFLIKYGKNVFIKGPFPWLANWFFTYVGSNVIGKGTTIEEQVCGDKFCEVGNNCYIGPNSVLTTHLVEGVMGRITYFKIKVGDNSVFTALGCVAPGGYLEANTYLLPYASCFKYSHLKGNNYYFGIPVRKIFRKKVIEYLKLSEEDLEKEKSIIKKQSEKKEIGEHHE
ncbi:MAG: hypothetical protein ACTSR8_02075 [Promethearchaeota archaeon]